MSNKSIFNDPDFPRVNKSVEINDFVVNKDAINDIVPMSVGVVRKILSGDKSAMIYFIGKDKLIKVDISNLVVIDIYKTGKEVGTSTPPFKYKICNKCHILKNHEEEFSNNQRDGGGRNTTRPSCSVCRAEIEGRDMRASEKRRMEQIKPKDYELFECPICHKVSIPFVTAKIVIDHDHDTGMARSWICDSCNTGLGRFQDSIELLEEAIKYLKKYSN